MLTQHKTSPSIKDRLNDQLATLIQYNTPTNFDIFQIIAEYWVYLDTVNHQILYYGLEYDLGPNIVFNSGAFGVVTLFKTNDEKAVVFGKAPFKEIAVKTPNESSHELMCQNEERIWNIIYPENPSYLYTPINSTLPLLFMPALGHKTLYEWMRHPKTSTIDKLEILLAAALELERIHLLKILHKDIASRNILVTLDNNVFRVNYIDFGISHDDASFFEDEIRNFCGMIKQDCLFFDKVDNLDKTVEDVIQKDAFYSLGEIMAVIKLELAKFTNFNRTTPRLSL